MYDLLIRGGKVLDGTGNPWLVADVAVQDGKLTLLRGDTASVEAARIIDVREAVVCPGFIDVHSHSGLMALQEPWHEAKVRQGVTTELVGVDGLSYAPFFSAEDFSSFAELNAGLDGPSPVSAPWSSVAEYLEALDGHTVCNMAYVIGNSALRIAAMGWEDRHPMSDELARMQEVLRQGMHEGAFGLSTGLTYPPGSYADTEELVALCRVVQEAGGIYVTHLRYNLGDRFLDPCREAIDIGRMSSVPVHISHFNSPRPGGAHLLLGLIDAAREEGLDVTYDAYPYPYTSSRLVALVPEWAHQGGSLFLVQRLRNKADRKRMAEDPDLAVRDFTQFLVTNFSRPRNQAFDGSSLAVIAQALGRSVVDTLCELLIKEELRLSYVGLGGDPVNIRQFYQHPAHMVASDALLLGKHPNPRTYGCYPMVLGELCREEKLLSLPQAVHKMTGLPAQRLGLRDRGILRDGYAADIVIFSPERVRSRASLEHPQSFPEGIDYVIINGVPVIDGGRHTGALPGRALRHR